LEAANVVTGRATAGIAFTQQAIFNFFSLHRGDTIIRIRVKFSRQRGHVSSAMPNFTPIREYSGVSGPKTRKIAKIFNFFAQ